MEPHFWQQTNREESVFGISTIERFSAEWNSWSLSPDVTWAIHSEIRLDLSGQKTPNIQIWIIPISELSTTRPYKSMGGQFKSPLTQRGLISPNQTELYQRLHSPPSSHGNLAASSGGAKECFRRSLPCNDTNSSRSERSQHKEWKMQKTKAT